MASASFTPLALHDLKEIRDFIAKDKSGIASQYMTMLKQKCELLASSPRLGVQREEYCKLYKFPVDSYLIFIALRKQASMLYVYFTVTETLIVFLILKNKAKSRTR